MTLRTELGRVRGLGSAKEGVAHWWAQRLTAVALVPLVLWLVWGVTAHVGAGHAAVVGWLREPFTAIAMVLTVAVGFYHAQLGMQVVIEDYVHTEWRRIAGIVLVKFIAAAIGVAGVFSVLKIAFSG